MFRIPRALAFFVLGAAAVGAVSVLLTTGTFRTTDLIVDDTATINDNIVMTTTGDNGAHPAIDISFQPVGATVSYMPPIYARNFGSYNTTASGLNAPSIYGECAASRSAGANTLICSGVYGQASGTAPDNRAVRGVTTGNTASANNYAGAFVTTSNGNNSLNWGVYGDASGAATGGVNYGVYASASGASVANWALYTLSGDIALNVASGALFTFGNAELGDGESDRIQFRGKPYGRGTAPGLSSCGTNPAIVGNDKAGTVTLGTGTPTACTLTFNAAWATNAPICTVTPGTAAITVYVSASSTTAVTFTISAGTDGAVLHYNCIGRL